MNKKVCIIPLDFVIGFAFLSMIKETGRTAISERRIEKYLNQTIRSMNNFSNDVQFLPNDFTKEPLQYKFFKFDKNTKRYLLKKNVSYEELQNHYYGIAEKISREYDFKMLVPIMESNINTFVLYY